MTQNKGRGRDKNQANTQAERSPAQTVGAPVPALVERAEPEVAYYKPQEDEGIPKNRFTRWLYHRAQIVLSVLTFAVVLFNAIQWWETRSTRELENRAYIVAQGVTLAPLTIPDLNDVVVLCVNAGRTPGRNGNIITMLERRQESPPENTVINPREGRSSKILFGPGVAVNERAGFMPIPKQVEVPPTQTAPSPNGGQSPTPTPTPSPTPSPAPEEADKRLWYLYGEITYEDIFGVAHRTKFCFQNQPHTASWAYCPTFNDAN